MAHQKTRRWLSTREMEDGMDTDRCRFPIGVDGSHAQLRLSCLMLSSTPIVHARDSSYANRSCVHMFRPFQSGLAVFHTLDQITSRIIN